jgi:hypothetical protein
MAKKVTREERAPRPCKCGCQIWVYVRDSNDELREVVSCKQCFKYIGHYPFAKLEAASAGKKKTTKKKGAKGGYDTDDFFYEDGYVEPTGEATYAED